MASSGPKRICVEQRRQCAITITAMTKMTTNRMPAPSKNQIQVGVEASLCDIAGKAVQQLENENWIAADARRLRLRGRPVRSTRPVCRHAAWSEFSARPEIWRSEVLSSCQFRCRWRRDGRCHFAPSDQGRCRRGYCCRRGKVGLSGAKYPVRYGRHRFDRAGPGYCCRRISNAIGQPMSLVAC